MSYEKVKWSKTSKIEQVCCISYACMSENTEQVTLRSKYEEKDFQETSRQNAVMMLAIQETSRCGAVMTLESKFTFTSFDKETVLSFIPCHSIRCILLLSVHIFCSRPLNKNTFLSEIKGENMSVRTCISMHIKVWTIVFKVRAVAHLLYNRPDSSYD